MTTSRTNSTPKPAAALTGSWDYTMIAIVSMMLALGLAMVFSASYSQNGTVLFMRQTAWIALSIATAFVLARIPYSIWRRLAVPIMILALGMLVAVLIFGVDILGAKRTFKGSIQPGEFAKLAVVIYVSAWAASKGRRLSEMQEGLIPFIIIMGIVTLLLVMEPSYSVAMIIIIIGVSIFFVAGGDIKQMLLLGLLAAPAVGLALWRSKYPIQRIQNWLTNLSSPGQAASDTMSIWQKQTSGPTNLLDRLVAPSAVPLSWSDYQFTFIADKLGFIGALLVVVLYAALAYRLLAIALNAPDRFATFVAVGITAWIVTQALIHIGASTNLTPATGQPLPLMSYGGSDMLACMMALGIMQSISRGTPAKKALYATLALGGWNRRPRLPNPNRSGSAKAKPSSSSRSTTGNAKSGAKKGQSASSPAYGHETPAVHNDELDRGPAWRKGSGATKRKSRGTTARKPTSRRQ